MFVTFESLFQDTRTKIVFLFPPFVETNKISTYRVYSESQGCSGCSGCNVLSVNGRMKHNYVVTFLEHLRFLDPVARKTTFSRKTGIAACYFPPVCPSIYSLVPNRCTRFTCFDSFLATFCQPFPPVASSSYSANKENTLR